MYFLKTLKKQIKTELEKTTGKKIKEKNFSYPPNSNLGDLSVNIAFEIAKEQKINPKQAAEEILNKLSKIKGIKEIKAINGFINFYFDYPYFSEKVLNEAIEKNYGSSKIGENKTIFIDFSSVNIAKPMHVGHLRSTVIGASLYNLLNYVGFNCYSENYLGDWGLQFGKLMYAYKLWGDETQLEKNPIKHLNELYVKFHELENDELKKEAEQWLTKLEKKDKEAVELWQKFRELSLKKFSKVYELLNVKFDSFNGESFYSKFNEEIIKEALNKNIAFKEKEKTIIVPLEKFGLTNARLMENGRTLYITRELAAAKYRKKKFNFYKTLYVVSSAQSLHFQQLKKILELLGYKWANDCEHIKFGLFSLPEGKISTRKGKIIRLQEVLDKAVEKAFEIINEKNPELENKQQTAEKIGVGAVKFADLSQNRIKDVVFDFEKMISFEGNTSPYLQYAYVRCNAILEKNKANEQKLKKSKPNFSELTNEEKQLIKKISEFSEIIEKSALQYEPHQLAQYLLELAHDFSSFYEKYKVIGNNERILIVKATSNILKIGLNLLGIKVIKKM